MVFATDNEGKGDPGANTIQRKIASASSSSNSTSTDSSASSSSTSVTDDEANDAGGDTLKKNAETEEIVRKSTGRRPLTGKLTSSKSGIIRKRKRKERPVTICLTNCRYEIVRHVGRRNSLMEVNEDEGWNIYWTDFSVSLERAMDMRRFQIVNHFPGMNEICRKDLLCRNLNRMKRLFPQDYEIYPKTWSLPTDLGELQTYAHTRKNKTYICKPEMGCQGRGIFLIRNIKDLNPFGKIICQLYIAKPFLIDCFKFDLRIYVLITSVEPLRVYVYKEGLARFATAKYKPPTNSNTENSYMHLTNYAVNKYSRDYVVDDEGGSKRKLSSVYKWLEDRNHDVPSIIEAMDEVILKTIIAAHPVLKHNYRTCFPSHDICSACFEILGFDILLDYRLKPFVLEVNHSPSFHTDTKLDLEIKEGLLEDTFAMLNTKKLDKHKVESVDRKRVQERLLQKPQHLNTKREDDKSEEHQSVLEAQFVHEMANCGEYRLIYPKTGTDKYDPFMEQNYCSLYQETAASQARANCTRTQLEEYNQKKLEDERKRVGGTKDTPGTSKDKVRPESPSEKTSSKMSNYELGGTFAPTAIINDEEVERSKGLMQRGILIRSLGVELQAFKLLCQLGTLKPEEEKVFRRMHGMNNVEWQKYKDSIGESILNIGFPFQMPNTGQADGHGDTGICTTPRSDSEIDIEYQSLSSWRKNLVNSCNPTESINSYQINKMPNNSKMAGRYSIQNYNVPVQSNAPILMTNPINMSRVNVNSLSNNPMRQNFVDSTPHQQLTRRMASIIGESGPPSPFQKQVFQNQPSTDIQRRYEHVIEKKRGSNFQPTVTGNGFGGLGSCTRTPQQLHLFSNQVNTMNSNGMQLDIDFHRNISRVQGSFVTPSNFANADYATKNKNWNIGHVQQNQNEATSQMQIHSIRNYQPTNLARFPYVDQMSLPKQKSNFYGNPFGHMQTQSQVGRGFLNFGQDNINKGTGLYQLGGQMGRKNYGRTNVQPIISRPQIGPLRDISNPLMLTGIRIGPRINQ